MSDGNPTLVVRGEQQRRAATARWNGEYARDLRARKLQAAIEEALSKAPPLTDEQCSRLRALLGGGR